MIDKSASDSKKGQKNDVSISCWNCFIVENDNDSEPEVPLSQIRQKYRNKFKLYPMFISELTRPKTVALKQKVKENYAVTKKIENKLVNQSKEELPSGTSLVDNADKEDSNIGSCQNSQQVQEIDIQTEFHETRQQIEETDRQFQIHDSNQQEVELASKGNQQHELDNKTQQLQLNQIDQENDITEIGQENILSSHSDIQTENNKENTVILYKVQIETSTPKLSQDITKKQMTIKCAPLTADEVNLRKSIDNIIIGIQNISLLDKEHNNIAADKSDNSSSNYSESGYEGSSLRDFNDIETIKKDPTQIPKDRSKSYIPLPIKRKSIDVEEEFKSSLPALNVTQKRNILKSTRSLYEGVEPEDKPAKSLRWSTLDLPHRSRKDDVYLSDAASPNHATLPRRSNSPLPHERDLLDRDRFSLNRSGLQARSESMASVYSGAGEGTRGTVTVRGEVQISLLYNYRLGALEVGVKRCRELAPVDIKRNRSDPYVKVYLLPDKSKAGKRKTKVKKNTLNPVFEETLSFVQPLASLSARTLWLSVWHADMFGRNDFLGEVTLPLADVVFDDPAPMWYKLHERTEQFDEQQGSRGDLIVALKLELSGSNSARGPATLHVLVKEAKNLVATKPNGLADVFCKSYLLPERGRLAKQKTAVCRRTLNPRWEHTFTYRGLSVQELSARALELSLWDRDRLASNDFMGAIRLSLGTGTYMGAPVNWMDSVGKEVSLWQMMLQQPNFWVEGSFPLRPHLNN